MTPLISVILPFHDSKNHRFLDLTIESLRRQTEVPIEVLVLPSSETEHRVEPIQTDTFGLQVYRMPGKSTFAKKMNYGVKLSDPRSKYIMLLSDDVILGKGCLKAMAETCADNHVIVNPMSNCDNGRVYFTEMPWTQELKYEDVDLEEVINYPNRLQMQFVTDAVCFYATMIPRETWKLVGELDESFDTGCEDTDYCMRARGQGIPSIITMRAFALHFVGKTSSQYCTKEITDKNHDLFAQKWGFRLVPKSP